MSVKNLHILTWWLPGFFYNEDRRDAPPSFKRGMKAVPYFGAGDGPA